MLRQAKEQNREKKKDAFLYFDLFVYYYYFFFLPLESLLFFFFPLLLRCFTLLFTLSLSLSLQFATLEVILGQIKTLSKGRLFFFLVCSSLNL